MWTSMVILTSSTSNLKSNNRFLSDLKPLFSRRVVSSKSIPNSLIGSLCSSRSKSCYLTTFWNAKASCQPWNVSRKKDCGKLWSWVVLTQAFLQHGCSWTGRPICGTTLISKHHSKKSTKKVNAGISPTPCWKPNETALIAARAVSQSHRPCRKRKKIKKRFAFVSANALASLTIVIGTSIIPICPNSKKTTSRYFTGTK